MKKLVYIFVCLGLLGVNLAVYAEPAMLPVIPSSTIVPIPRIDPARVKDSLEKPAMPRYQPHPSIPLAAPATIPAKAAKIHFVLKDTVFEGMTVYTKAELAPLYKDYLGKKISLAELYQIVNALTVKYRQDGYVLSRAILPEQKIQNGIVKIQVLEGHIQDFSIEGNSKGAFKQLQTYGDKIKADKPLRMSTIEHYTLLANDIPGMSVRAVLAPSKTTVGASDLVFIVKQKRLGLGVSYDNRGTAYIGPHQLYATLDINNPFDLADRLSLRSVATPSRDELRFVQAEYMLPLGTSGLKAGLIGDYIETNPGFTLEPLNITGRSKSWTASISYPWLRSRRTNFYTTLEYNWLDSETEFPAATLFMDHIRSLRLSGSFDHLDTLRGLNTTKLEISQGLKMFGASGSSTDNFTSRIGGKPDYTKLTLDLSRLQALGPHFSFLLAGTGQYAFNQPLLSSEEFGFGGSQFGRGYDPSEITGDEGIAGKAELQLNVYPGFRWLKYTQYYVFYDAGMVWNIGEFNQQPFRLSATSGGVGIRAYFNQYLYANVEVTKPLTYPVLTLVNMGKDGNGSRVFFSINAVI